MPGSVTKRSDKREASKRGDVTEYKILRNDVSPTTTEFV